MPAVNDRRRAAEPKRWVCSQRYTTPEITMLESVAGREVNDFIRSAALDRARQMADAGIDVRGCGHDPVHG